MHILDIYVYRVEISAQVVQATAPQNKILFRNRSPLALSQHQFGVHVVSWTKCGDWLLKFLQEYSRYFEGVSVLG